MESKSLDQLEIDSFEVLINGLINQEYGIDNNFLDASTCTGLMANLTNLNNAGLMLPASVGRKLSLAKDTSVRSDSICWIDNDSQNEFELLFISKINRFITYLNSTCFTAINDYEFHYAQYEQGSFYKRHKDQFKSDSGRKFSFITYLNDSWSEEDGGALLLYLGDQTKTILPIGKKSVFFKSDAVEHEVTPSTTKTRYSITGWFKSV